MGARTRSAIPDTLRVGHNNYITEKPYKFNIIFKYLESAMADKSTIMRTFNTHFFEFMDDLISVFPDNHELKTARTSFDAIKRANPTVIIKVWYTHVYLAYRETLDAGDISYFINKDYSKDLSCLGNSSDIIQTIDKLREPLRSMTPTSTECSTKYIQNLCKLSTIYNNM